MTDTQKLRDAIARSGLKYKFLAELLGITSFGFQKKIENQTEFKASEIIKLSDALNLVPKERDKIFFAQKSD